MKDGILRNELFVCDHLGTSAHDEKDIMGFSVGHPSGTGLVNYLRYHAFPDENISTAILPVQSYCPDMNPLMRHGKHIRKCIIH